MLGMNTSKTGRKTAVNTSKDDGNILNSEERHIIAAVYRECADILDSDLEDEKVAEAINRVAGAGYHMIGAGEKYEAVRDIAYKICDED